MLKASLNCNEMTGDSSVNILASEKQLLSLASYPDCTDGILYALPVVAEVSGKVYLYIRCIETGVFNGFVHVWHKVIFEDLINEEKIDHILINIYNQWDIEAAYSHRVSFRKGTSAIKNSKVFKQVTMMNKTSINNTIPLSYEILKKS